MFPGLSLDNYPFNTDRNYNNNNLNLAALFNRIIEVKGSDSILYSANLTISGDLYRLMSNIFMSNIYYSKYIYQWGDNKIPCISFLFHAARYSKSELNINSAYTGTATLSMPIDTIGDIKTISIELEEI